MSVRFYRNEAFFIWPYRMCNVTDRSVSVMAVTGTTSTGASRVKRVTITLQNGCDDIMFGNGLDR